ncbi:MAG: carbon-nitrogen hydrolase family protein [Thermoplasmata archaeon]
MKAIFVQKKHILGNKEHNLDIVLNTASNTDTELLIFPEMFLTGYTLGDKIWELAEVIPGPSSEKISKVSVEKDVTIVCGMPEKELPGYGRLFNSALVTTPDGGINSYRKIHLPNFGPFQDKRYFESGGLPELIDTPVGKIGLIICYDIFFPELSKYYAMNGADMIICISASPSTTRVFFEKVMFARAIENTCYLLYSNLIGREEQMMFWGGAAAVSPKGTIITKVPYFEESLQAVEMHNELDIAKSRRGRPALDDTTEMFQKSHF